MNLLRLTLTGLLLTGSVVAADWMQFRGPDGNGVSPDAQLPTTLDPQSVVWTADLPGRGVSSPIIVRDRVFVTSTSGPRNAELRVLCFALSDGHLIWERQFWATGRTMTHEKISGATPTPVSDGQHLFALFSSNDCAALDLDGNLLWYRGLGRDYPNANNSLGMSSSLAIADGTLVAQVESQSESFTAGLDPATGKNRWRIERPRTSNWTSPVVFREPGGRTLVLLLSSNGLAAVDARDGSPVWSHGDKGSTVPSVTASGGRLYVPSNGLAVLEPVAGAAPKEVWRSTQLRTGTPSPVVLGNRVFLLNDGGILSCGDATDGKRLWQLRLDGPFSATPVVAGGLLYCVNEKGVVQVVDPSKPEGERVATLNLGQTVIATPSIASNSLFVRSDGRLWRIGRGSPL